MIEIPLNSNPEQLFSSSINGLLYTFRVVLNSRKNVWTLSISQNGESLIDGVAMVGGVNIVEQYNIGISNIYTVNIENPNLVISYNFNNAE